MNWTSARECSGFKKSIHKESPLSRGTITIEQGYKAWNPKNILHTQQKQRGDSWEIKWWNVRNLHTYNYLLFLGYGVYLVNNDEGTSSSPNTMFDFNIEKTFTVLIGCTDSRNNTNNPLGYLEVDIIDNDRLEFTNLPGIMICFRFHSCKGLSSGRRNLLLARKVWVKKNKKESIEGFFSSLKAVQWVESRNF